VSLWRGKSGTDRTGPSRLEGSAESDKNPRKVRKAVRVRRHHPPPEEDLGGGDICSLEEKPSTEDNMPLVAHVAVGSPKEGEFEDYNPKRSLRPVANRADGRRLRDAIVTDRRSRPAEPALRRKPTRARGDRSCGAGRWRTDNSDPKTVSVFANCWTTALGQGRLS
jgi:hypothetical protein